METCYGVELSETARNIYNQWKIDATIRASAPDRRTTIGKIHRTRMLMVQLATEDDATGDHRAFPNTDLLYRSDGSTYIYYFRIDEPPIKLIYVAFLCEMNTQQASTILLSLIESGKADVLASLGVHSVPQESFRRSQIQ